MRLFLLIALIGAFLSGCATVNQRCEYYETGTLSHYRLRSTVVGTGETELVTTECTELAYSTEDTGLSDNGVSAVGLVAEKVVEGIVPHAAAMNAATEVVPSP
jgi:hypothetical protein